MFGTRLVCLVPLLLAVALMPARASDIHAGFAIHDGWGVTYEDKTPDYRLAEYVPDGEDYKKWTEMITLIQFEVTGEEATGDILDQAMSGIAQRCQEKALAVGDYWDKEDKTQGLIASIACDDIDIEGAPPGIIAYRKELLRVFVSDTKDGIVMLQYVWHDQEKSAKERFRSQDNWNRFKQMVRDLPLNR